MCKDPVDRKESHIKKNTTFLTYERNNIYIVRIESL